MSLPKITIVEAMKILLPSWNEQSAQTIINCFIKAGISESSQQLGNVRLTSFKDLKVELDYFKELCPAVVPFQQPVWGRNKFLSNSLDSRIS